MFSSLGWPEIGVLLLLALFIFGPDKLPGAVKQASSALRTARETITGARDSIQKEFGDVMPNIDPDLLNPKAFVKKHLLDDLDLTGTSTTTPVASQTPPSYAPPLVLPPAAGIAISPIGSGKSPVVINAQTAYVPPPEPARFDDETT